MILRSIAHNPNDPNSVSSDWITCMYEDQDSVLWVGTDNELNRFDRKIGSFQRFIQTTDDTTSTAVNHIRAIYESRFGNKSWFWLSTGIGLFLFNRNEEKFEPVYFVEGDRKYQIGGRNFICEDDSGYVRMGSGWIYRFDPRSQ